jgi:hypothetical protein
MKNGEINQKTQGKKRGKREKRAFLNSQKNTEALDLK